MSTEEETVKDIIKVPLLQHADSEILWNLFVQLTLSIIILVVYIILRPRVLWLYSPNIQGKKSHPCFGYSGFFNWLIPVLTVTDTKLLVLIGLDAFMMLQTIKFLFKVFLILCITVLPVIGYVYSSYFTFSGKVSTQYITRISIGTGSDYELSYYLILFYSYLITALVFYLIYIYYKRYTVLRQIYLRDPSTLTSIINLKTLSKRFESHELAVEYLGISNRALLLSNLPNFINTNNDLKLFVKELHVGEIEDSVVLHDTTTLRKLYDEKQNIIENIEKEINQILIKMNDWSIEHKQDCIESFTNFKDSLQQTTVDTTLNEHVDIDRKQQIFKTFVELDDKFKTTLNDQERALNYYFYCLKTVVDKIIDEKKNLNGLKTKGTTDDITNLIEEQNALFIPGDIDKDASFFSFYHFLKMKRYWMYFSLDIPIGAKKGFVVFKNHRDASIVKQAKIGSKIFSIKAEDAPTPNDIIWENVNKSGFVSFVFKTFGDFAFLIFNVIFAYLVVQTIDMVKIERFEKNGMLKKFFDNHPAVSDLYTGLIPALVYNLMLLVVPMVITTLINLEGINSYSKAQKRTMSRYSNFLFFNAFLSVFFATTIYTSLLGLLNGKLTLREFIVKLGENVLISVVLFVNTAIQKSFFGIAMLLLKPGPLIMNYFLRNTFGKKTKRQHERAEFIPPFDFGAMFPEILIVFPMLFAYTLIFPFVLLLGLFYFGVSYLFFKNDFLYSSRNSYESGGKYWEQAVVIIIYSVLAFQVATAAVIFFHGEKFIAFLFLPLFYVTFNYNTHLNEIFCKSCNAFPLNYMESTYLDRFTEKLKQDKIHLLENWEEESPGADIDTLDLRDIGYKDSEDSLNTNSFYKEPSTSVNTRKLLLPRNFFKTLLAIKKIDKQNFYGYKNLPL